MTERVVFTGRCKRRRHVLFTLIETDDAFIIAAPLRAAGRESNTWLPTRRQFDPLNGHATRYGCRCTATTLIDDAAIWERLRRGESTWVIAATNISER